MNNKDALFMDEALEEAKKAYVRQEVPIGAVAVQGNKILARAHNRSEYLKDPLEHAEVTALRKVQKILGRKWLDDVELYVTIEPCIFCAGAMTLLRIKRLVFGAVEPRTGAFGSKMDITALGLNHAIDVTSGVRQKECAGLMQKFFKKLRRENKNQPQRQPRF